MYWLKGFYLPIVAIWDEEKVPPAPEGGCTVYCLYLITYSDHVETEAMAGRPPEVANAVLDIGIKLHETPDFFQAMAGVAGQIKEFCGAEKCSLYTVDKTKNLWEMDSFDSGLLSDPDQYYGIYAVWSG